MRGLTLSIYLALCAACGGEGRPHSPESEIRAWVDRGEAAAEAKDRGDLLEMISPDYADARGNSHEDIGKILRIYFFRQNSIALLTNIDSIAMMGDTAAMVDVTVGMVGTNNRVLGLSADAYRFEFELEKPADEWVLIGARWGKLGSDLR